MKCYLCLDYSTIIQAAGKLETNGVVTIVYENAFDVLLVDYGLTRRVYLSVSRLYVKNRKAG